MALVLVRNGASVALSYLTGKTTVVRDLVYRLYTNTITPAETDTAASYTEAAGGGYAAKTLTGASWGVTEGAPTVASFAQQDWTFTGPLTDDATVRGYYVTRVTDADLILAESFTAFQPQNDGDKILLTPQITAATAA